MSETVHRPPSFPPVLAGLSSLILPGLGQALARRVQRGILFFSSFITLLVMSYWRIALLARLEPTLTAKLAKAFSRRPLFTGLLLAGMAFLWLWGAYDAYRAARFTTPSTPEPGVPHQAGTSTGAGRPAGMPGVPHQARMHTGAGLFLYILILFFILGLQIAEVDVGRMVTQFPEAWVPLSKVLWPWEAAVTRDTEMNAAGAEILVPCSREVPAPPLPIEEAGKPYLKAEPNCGELSRVDENNRLIDGSHLKLTGKGFAPNKATEIWWIDPLHNEFQMRQQGQYITVTTDGQGAFSIEVVMPYRLLAQAGDKPLIHRVEARQVARLGGLKASESLLLSIARMVETIFMGMMATVFGIFLAIPISFLAARNLMSGSWITLAIYYLTRTLMNIVRAIEPLIWALIAVVWVGLGPFAGIIALTVHSVAALGKMYSEAIEGIDQGPIEAVQATGATKLQTIIFAVVPQMIAPFVSFSIYRWDINVRMSTVIGLVGGGGIGFILVQYIRLLDYRSAGIAVWFIAVTVAVLDYVSAEIRQRFV